MANYRQLSYGATGDDVKQLQEKLNAAGNYNLDTDGIYGDKTKAAVTDYQQKNSLKDDGIAGKNTWDSLNSGLSSDAAKTPNTQYNSGFTYGDFAGNDDPVVNEAWNVLNQHQGSKPGEYSPVWQDEADAYLNQYQNRDPFSYDFNSDALYQQYKDNYIQQGQMAMMDTMGQAAAMTGGYGNSYAQTAGQQAYNLYMNQLNDIMPELYQMAHDRYTQEGQDMLAMYDLYMNKENYEYSKYQDVLNNWYQEDSRLQGNYDSAYNRAWNEYLEGKNTAYNDYWNNINMNYQKERDEVADKQWQATFDENKRQADRSYNLSASKAYSYTGNDGDVDEYKDIPIGSKDYGIIESAINGATTLEELQGILSQYADDWKYNPAQLDALAAGKKKELEAAASDANIKKFLSTLPYAHAGSSIDGWKNVVRGKLNAAVNNGSLTPDEQRKITIQLGL